ncbi:MULTISPECIES: GNAT family N-acetyltransferase [Streptomyces]|uniref:GNAT family N-acetyltransferase n=1 Tax=Streptomyces TaxID=1883 RepID=UPI00163CA244|nr:MULTISPECIES: GNAT family N-acetyltransferase [Streptomyces]MBC2876092.1 GNAT family N-acetyltransferase [Streptomyces sp. TYQ1024]UBI38451.1 GNAT family N-acetyltransferase [Streptomyces mobaraensis]UKW31036.1 GNAT family N-acetyltransferase [Streptomyces sp. TYQ1024]
MFSIEVVNDAERRDVIRRRLAADNNERSPVMRSLRGTAAEHSVPVELYSLDGEGELAGGLTGHVQYRWLHIGFLWVDARHRGTGLGGRLVAAAEESARRRHGCVGSRVETWDFQAPDFYRKQGYQVVATVEDYPPGVTEYTLIKSLATEG